MYPAFPFAVAVWESDRSLAVVQGRLMKAAPFVSQDQVELTASVNHISRGPFQMSVNEQVKLDLMGDFLSRFAIVARTLNRHREWDSLESANFGQEFLGDKIGVCSIIG
jgi:hypothetical protein